MTSKISGDSTGLPHSSHSMTVSGSDGIEDGVERVDERDLGDDGGPRHRGPG